MSDPHLVRPEVEPVDVIVGSETIHSVILVEVVQTQGFPGPPGPVGPVGPEGPVGELPPVTAADLGKLPIVRNPGPDWTVDSLHTADITGALGYTPANKAGDTFGGTVKAPTVWGDTVYAGTDGDLQISTVPTVSSTLRFSRLFGPTRDLHCDLATGQLRWSVGGATKITFEPNGGATFGGLLNAGAGLAVAGSATVSVNLAVSGAINVNTGLYVTGGAGKNPALLADANSTVLYFDGVTAGASSLLQYTYTSKLLSYFSNGVSLLSVDAVNSRVGCVNIVASGIVSATTLYAGAQYAGIAAVPNNYSQVILDASVNAVLQYSMTAKRLSFYINGVALFSIDQSGNVVAKGTFTTGTPADFEALGIFDLEPEQRHQLVEFSPLPDAPPPPPNDPPVLEPV